MNSLGWLRRTGVVIGVAATDVGCWTGLAADRAALGAPAPDLPTLLSGGAAWVVQGCLVWLSLLVLLVALEPLLGRELTAYAGCPVGLRRLLVLACGTVLVGTLGGLGTAQASEPHPAAPDSGSTLRLDGLPLNGLPLPDRAVDPERAPAAAAAPRTDPEAGTAPAPRRAAAPRPQQTGSPSAPPGDVVVVRPGDSLWRLTADHLATRDGAADPALVDRAWRATYAANVDVIGPDPDLIRPGTRLRLVIPEKTTQEDT